MLCAFLCNWIERGQICVFEGKSSVSSFFFLFEAKKRRFFTFKKHIFGKSFFLSLFLFISGTARARRTGGGEEEEEEEERVRLLVHLLLRRRPKHR